MGMGLCDQTAMDVIQKYSKQDLANIIYEYGEEHFSRRIAENIKKNLRNIHTTEDLANIIRSCVRKTGKIDPATKTFQALRIFVNQELEELKKVLQDSVNLLNPGGKIVVVSFHSLEDRIVKLFFRELMRSKTSEINFTLLTKKPITPSTEEISVNPKSRSAKLRGISMLC
jgi:16S rRNA (cytosine1402-N4)-methyltransferase